MTGKHYNWHKRWILDAPERGAKHESGLTVRYATECECADLPPVDIDRKCWHDDQAWVVICTLSGSAMAAWIDQQQAQGVRGADAIAKRVSRLMREAGDLWVNHKKREKRR
ncbi:hypothetical protein FACS1894116_03600 [Betaproteobacteria bacterium]|nr:hypothetical protein FACS1894116_03600 [Betaproteobacteria bacterium]GHU27115.1 hypothetical protein FACS189488_15200 [Betaproteobacteria bacterium]GHU29199.1 hypothetical protein FACS189497_06670 [Betaproteobacteria bacterium]